MQAGYCCACSDVQVYRRICSQPSAFTSCRNTTSAHFPTCVLQQIPILGTKVPFSTDSTRITGISLYSFKKAGISEDLICSREGYSTEICFHGPGSKIGIEDTTGWGWCSGQTARWSSLIFRIVMFRVQDA